LPLSQAFLFLVAGWALPLSPNLARLSLFIYSSGRDSPPPLFGTQSTPPSLPCVFIVLIAYYSVSLFFLGGSRSVQGAMLIWPRDVCGSTVYRLAHLVHVFPSRLGAGIWWPGGPPGFSVQPRLTFLIQFFLNIVPLSCSSMLALDRWVRSDILLLFSLPGKHHLCVCSVYLFVFSFVTQMVVKAIWMSWEILITGYFPAHYRIFKNITILVKSCVSVLPEGLVMKSG
jgi:hypothetical protein